MRLANCKPVRKILTTRAAHIFDARQILAVRGSNEVHHGIFSEARPTVVVLIIQPHQRKTVRRELRSGRMNLYFVDWFIDGVSLG